MKASQRPRPWYFWVGLFVACLLVTVLLNFIVSRGLDAIPNSRAPITDVSVNGMRGNAARSDIRDSLSTAVFVNLTSGQVLVNRFRSGAMRNSHGILLPLHVRRMVARQVNTPTERKRTWWRKTLNTGACISNMGGYWAISLCLTWRQWDNDKQYRWWKSVTKVKLLCGGAAVFGAVRGGGWKGALVGASACAFGKAVDLW